VGQWWWWLWWWYCVVLFFLRISSSIEHLLLHFKFLRFFFTQKKLYLVCVDFFSFFFFLKKGERRKEREKELAFVFRMKNILFMVVVFIGVFLFIEHTKVEPYVELDASPSMIDDSNKQQQQQLSCDKNTTNSSQRERIHEKIKPIMSSNYYLEQNAISLPVHPEVYPTLLEEKSRRSYCTEHCDSDGNCFNASFQACMEDHIEDSYGVNPKKRIALNSNLQRVDYDSVTNPYV